MKKNPVFFNERLAFEEKLKCLRENDHTLTELSIKPSLTLSIGDETIEQLADAVASNTHLKKLKIIGNPPFGVISSNGVKKLAAVLTNNEALEELTIQHTHIADIGAEAFAEMLKTNYTLTTLNLSHSLIGSEGVKALQEALITNYSLRVLDISHCTVRGAIKDWEIEKLLNRNLRKDGPAYTEGAVVGVLEQAHTAGLPSIPPEVGIYIAKFLDRRDGGHMAQTCTAAINGAESFWQNYIKAQGKKLEKEEKML